MRRFLLCCCLLGTAVLEAEDFFGEPEPGEAGQGGLEGVIKGHEDGKAEEPATDSGKPTADNALEPGRATVTNTAFLTALREFAGSHKLRLQEQGDGPFRLLLVGGASVPNPADCLLKGRQALEGLEVWSGRQGLFLPTAADQANWLIVCPENHFDAFVDWTRARGAGVPEGEDLVKKLKTYHGDRCSLIGAEKVNRHPIMPAHWAVNVSASLAIQAFFKERGGTAEPWLSEGLKAELEIVICDDHLPRITAIAYEDNNPAMQGGASWAIYVAKLIQAKDASLLTASNVMALDLIGLNATNYKQMWSFCQFIRTACGQTRGAKNKLAQVMELMATGTNGPSAIEAVLGKRDPALSRAWVAWAVQQR